MTESNAPTKVPARKIMVVDDVESVIELMREMLASFGYAPEICLTVDDAFAKFEPGKFDLVITDYTMPKMNGIDFAQGIKARAPAQPILLITGSAFPFSENARRQLPVDATLQKPFSVLEFQQAVAMLLKWDPASA